jgi:hypothetical protein
MKNILLALSLSCVITGLAQSSLQIKDMENGQLVAANSTITIYTYPDSIMTHVFDIKNTSNSTQVYNIKRYDMMLNTSGTLQAEAYFCVASYCYGTGVHESPNSLTLTSNQSASQIPGTFQMLSTDLQELTVPGNSWIKYTVYNIAAPSDSIQFNLSYKSYSTKPTSLAKNAETLNGFDIYPNPAKSSTMLRFNSSVSGDVRIEVYNALGSKVAEKQTTVHEGKNNIPLSVENLSPGVYLLNLRNGSTENICRMIVN